METNFEIYFWSDAKFQNQTKKTQVFSTDQSGFDNSKQLSTKYILPFNKSVVFQPSKIVQWAIFAQK